jgi:CrcB protein
VFFAIGAGGAVGSLARYGMKVAIPAPASGFPWATFLVNITGATMLGVLSAIPAIRLHLDSRLRVLIGTGFCGGLTTFSTLSLEVATRWGRVSALAVVYVTVSVMAAPVAVVLGRMPAARFFPEPPPPPEVSGEPPDLPPGALGSTDPEVG